MLPLRYLVDLRLFLLYMEVQMERRCVSLFVGGVLSLVLSGVAPAAPIRTLPDLITALGAVKPPVDIPEPFVTIDTETREPATGTTTVVRLNQTAQPPDPTKPNFCLDSNAAGGALVILESIPQGGANSGNVTPDLASDILAFPPGNACFLDLFSDPLPSAFQFVDPDGNNVGTPLTFAQMITGGGGRQVVFEQEGFLRDPRANAPLRADRNIQADFSIPDVTIFITPRPRDCTPANPLCGQIYIVHSDNPVPEPGTAALLAAGAMALLYRRRHPTA